MLDQKNPSGKLSGCNSHWEILHINPIKWLSELYFKETFRFALKKPIHTIWRTNFNFQAEWKVLAQMETITSQEI